jgi:hypothetical protein
MTPDHRPNPATIIGDLLTSHPEAHSLLAEASHRQALMVCSAVIARVKFSKAQAARLAYEELRHRLEPRRRHPLHFGMGLLLLVVVSAGLVLLVLIELSGLLGGSRSVLSALSATAVWLTVAWLAVLVVRRRRWTLIAAVLASAMLLEVLIVALHTLSPHPGGPDSTGHGSALFGALLGAFILMLTAGAAVLMAHMEPASVLLARQRWHQARSAYEEASATQQSDVEAAAVAAEAWLGLVRARVTEVAAGDESLARDTVALAAGLVQSGRPQLPPPM